MKKAVVIGIVVAMVLCAVAAWSQGGAGGRTGATGPGGARTGRGMMTCPAMALMPPQAGVFERAAATLQLTDGQDGQKAKLTAVLTTSDETMRPLVQKATEAAQALRTAVLAPKYDAAKVKELATAAGTAEPAIVAARIDTWTQIRGILTADQVAKLQEAMTMRRTAPGGPGPGPGTAPGGTTPSGGGNAGPDVPPPTPDQ